MPLPRLVELEQDQLSRVDDVPLDEHGRLREHVSLFVNGRDLRGLAPDETGLAPGDVLEIIPALSGGGGFA